MSISKKMNLSFVVIILLFMISSIMSYINSQKVDSNVHEILDNRLEQIRLIDEIRFGTGMQAQAIRSLITDSSNANIEELQFYSDTINEQIGEMEKLASSPEMKDYVKKLSAANIEFNDAKEQFLKYTKAKDFTSSIQLLEGNIASANKSILFVADNMLKYQNEQLSQLDSKTNQSIKSSTIFTIITLIVCILIVIFFMIAIKRTLTRPLHHMAEVANQMAEGNLSIDDVHVKAKDEIGDLAAANNKMKNNLRSLISQVQVNSQTLSASSEHLLASLQEVGSRANTMIERVSNTVSASSTIAHSANESSLAMEETAAGVQRIAESTQILLENSIQTHQMANDGGHIIVQAKDQMHNINESSKLMNQLVQKLSKQTEQIESITKVITDITEQTNLLALNAAIEAARAGEHGKGFAVVADEVRKLAEESKSSANQIVVLIQEIKADTYNVEKAAEESLHSVTEGVDIINHAGTAFNGIIEAVDRMTTQIQEISATSEQLSASAEEVSASVTDIASNSTIASTQVNDVSSDINMQIATMGEIGQVGEDLTTQAQELQAEIQKFKIKK